MPDFDLELDARGLNCPLPILRAKKSIQQLDSGQVLRIVSYNGTFSAIWQTDQHLSHSCHHFFFPTGRYFIPIEP